MAKQLWYVWRRKITISFVLFALATLPAITAGATDLLVFPRQTIHRHMIRASTVTDNGDLNPYAVVVAPVSAGKIHKDDVLIDNFNDISNLQGTGTSILIYSPSTKKTVLFTKLPRNLAQCPGGVGLTTAMTMLKTGWVIVGSTPSKDGTTKTKGNGCLLVLDANSQLAAVWTGPNINAPWGRWR